MVGVQLCCWTCTPAISPPPYTATYHLYQELTPLLRCLELLPHLASEMPRFKGDKSKGLADDVLRKASPHPSPNSNPNPNLDPDP